jgi:hypothetical protein
VLDKQEEKKKFIYRWFSFGSTHLQIRIKLINNEKSNERKKGKVNGSLLKVEDAEVQPDRDRDEFLDRVNGDKGRRYLDIFVSLSGVSSIPATVLCLALRFFFSSFQGFVVRTNS